MISLIMSGEKPEAIAKKHFKRLRGEALETLGYARTLYERIKRGNEVEAILEALSGLRRTIEAISGRRVDALWIDTTCVRDSVKSAEEAVESWARSRLLNPKWINAMLEHGYDGTREAMKRVEYLLGHAALTKAVEEWIWTEVARTYVLNDEVRERMKRSNPWALHRIMKVLHEARERGYWRPSKELLEKLEKLFIEVDGLLEEVSS